MKSSFFLISTLITMLSLAGCANTDGFSAKQSHSGFDNASVVTIAEHGNACKTAVCTGLGAQWSEAKPELAILSVQIYSVATGINSAKLNIDGKIIDLQKTSTITKIENSKGIKWSVQDFVAPLSLIEDITRSKKTWLRVMTIDGSFEDAVVDGKTDSKAFHALKRFLASIDEAKKTK